MDLVNEQVTHKVFGIGKVVKHNGSYVKIDFPSGHKKFVFPDAFGTYLTLTDPKTVNSFKKFLQEKKKAREEKEKQRLKEFKTFRNEQGQRFMERKELAKIRKTTHKINPRSQSVFWCEDQELDSVFTEWKVSTGVIISGQKKGQPKRLAQIGKNSACLITVRNADEPEKERRILGVFMVNKNFNNKNGYIPAHSEYRLVLSGQEAEQMLFWNYYINEKYPHKVTWNTGRHRYFNNVWMAQILQDIIALKKDPQEQEVAQRFFEYFCQMNRLNKEELPQPKGALLSVC